MCELVYAVGQMQPRVSLHLAALRDADVVTCRRQGQWIYYQLNPDLPEWVRQVIEITVAAAANQKPYFKDFAALAKMPNRPGEYCCN